MHRNACQCAVDMDITYEDPCKGSPNGRNKNEGGFAEKREYTRRRDSGSDAVLTSRVTEGLERGPRVHVALTENTKNGNEESREERAWSGE
ncbi:hypothetical protein CC1G_15657 [Coprinopsis cinerea okayama7|uniref:Uncharacterized protein n=1 Tax=Coprinopsis cinerea (strain Okayama-7 / 130 / ATCC MYA-4618 / FGSC 9003) TaxID=240176 RepID=D6RQB7_COPC7|nr:hypothetical protein CC1G_15657 [Coprinopsis cinerea okayama7\|eukprot:XP_002910227.1 hypothetical protein CC1G_15657 [Coprinopsis cinerea okayama7\